MMIQETNLKIGDMATSDYNGVVVTVKIVGRIANVRGCQSGVMYKVDPPLKNNNANAWYDAGWFKPVCKRCNGEMKPSKAIYQTYSGTLDFPGKEVVTMSPGGPGNLIDCLKCVACGWSVIVKGKS